VRRSVLFLATLIAAVVLVLAWPALAVPPPWAHAAGKPTTTTTAPGQTTTTRKPPKTTTTTEPMPTTTTITIGTCVGVSATPASFNQALINANPGATFCLASGLYEVGGLNIAGRTLQGASGNRSAVLLDGTVPVTNWEQIGASLWRSTGQAYNPVVVTPAENPAMEFIPANGHYADLLRNRVRLTRILNSTTPAAGEWAWDYAADIIYVGSDPTIADMRVTNQTNGLSGDGFTLRNLTLQWYGHYGIVDGADRILERVDLLDNHGVAIKTGGVSVVRDSRVLRNGQYGMASTSAAGMLVEGTEIAWNNALRFARSDGVSYYDAGATKFLFSQGFIFRNNYSHNNYSDGLWFDADNRDVEIYGNRLNGNERFAAFYEISRNAVVYDNEMLDNLQGGLYIATSGPVDAYNNTIRGPRGLFIRDDARENDTIDGLPRSSTGNDLHDNTVHHTAPASTFQTIGFGGLNAVLTKNNQFRSNDYTVPSPTTANYFQSGPSSGGTINVKNFAGFQADGFDTAGTIQVG
jgi:hypothetical protein